MLPSFGSSPDIEVQPPVVLLGVRVDPLTMSDLLRQVIQGVATDARQLVMYVNIHCVNVAEHDSAYRDILNAAHVVYCDGTGVRLGARLVGKCLPERMTGADWIHDLCRLAVGRGLSLFLLGDRPGVAERAARRLEVTYPGLNIVGCLSGYDVPTDAVETVNRANPDIVLVGMGTPRQEKWMSERRDELCAPILWGVGALFGFVSGDIPRGPRWMTQHGLEWLCRLATEPRKLWRRYLIGNPHFFLRLVRHYWLHQASPVSNLHGG